jgi:hypothetical protein
MAKNGFFEHLALIQTARKRQIGLVEGVASASVQIAKNHPSG